MVLTVQMTDIITQLNHGSDLSKLGHEADKGNDLFIKTSYALETMLNNPDKKYKQTFNAVEEIKNHPLENSTHSSKIQGHRLAMTS